MSKLVTRLHLWHVYTCYMPTLLTCLLMWHAYSCGIPILVTCLHMWYAYTILLFSFNYDLLKLVICLRLWHVYTCDMPKLVTCLHELCVCTFSKVTKRNVYCKKTIHNFLKLFLTSLKLYQAALNRAFFYGKCSKT